MAIPGSKILTLLTGSVPFVIDVHEDGSFGYFEGQQLLFEAKLHEALSERGSLMIRQFLPIKQKTIVKGGKVLWIPEKNLYGVFLNEGVWHGLSGETLLQMYSIDPKTGGSLPEEEGAHYRDFPPKNTHA